MKELAPLQKYLDSFGKLKRGITKYGPAPHKPVLLLSILQSYQNKTITNNQIYITPELVFLFKTNWTSLVNTAHVCTFALPFFHLKGEKFWHLIPKPGFEALLVIKESISSFTELNGAVQYAALNDDLFELMKDEKSNSFLQQFLLDEYFSQTKNNFSNSTQGQQKLFDEIEGKILKEDAAEYRAEIKKLIEQQDEEEIFLRGSVFKREIPKIYNNTCCISGMRIDAITNVSMIDACHIVPFSTSYDDTITNGIALCPNLHRAFDRGLIAIDNNYKVVVSKAFKEEESVYSVCRFEGSKIQLPKQQQYFPLNENLEWHRKNIFKH